MNGSPHIALIEMDNLKCDHCGCIYFTDVKVIKVIPGLLVGSTKDQYDTVLALRCVECGFVPNSEVLIPKPKPRIDP